PPSAPSPPPRASAPWRCPHRRSARRARRCVRSRRRSGRSPPRPPPPAPPSPPVSHWRSASPAPQGRGSSHALAGVGLGGPVRRGLLAVQPVEQPLQNARRRAPDVALAIGHGPEPAARPVLVIIIVAAMVHRVHQELPR